MEYKLLKKMVTTDIYNVNDAFYLIIPKIIVDKNIKIIIDNGVNSKLNTLSNTSSITIVRPFGENYFNDINNEISKQKLKVIINNDLNDAKRVLQQERIDYDDNITLSTPYEEFKEWYLSDKDMQKKITDISNNLANPEEAYTSDNDDINATLRLKKDLLELRKELVEKNQTGNEKGYRKVLSNGKSTLKSFDDGFVNIIFLSLVTLIVTVGTMLAMIYIMR